MESYFYIHFWFSVFLQAFVVANDSRGRVVETTLQDICVFKMSNSTLVLPPRSLPFGLSKLTVTVAPSGYELVTSSRDIYLQVSSHLAFWHDLNIQNNASQLDGTITDDVSQFGSGLSTMSDDVHVVLLVLLQAVQSEPVSIIDGGDVKTIMAYATAILDISQSYDPDLDTNVRKDLAFYLFCMPEASSRVRLLT